ncbi:hypothetical protein DMN91_012746 [Ooceraea biroi]|uniref:Sulfotransferase domain-containing protein n=1 Tax=Ooceraea biroi TaxID=2015173 RepID=A0A3L8D3M9_OOCBI|nr:hypothetical protein DMN91_012746 [Ooceraea biroi]
MPPTLVGQITMEKTPSYFVTSEVPRRVKHMNPGMKLIVVVRDPVTRAISDYTQVKSKRRKMPRFEDLAFLNGSRIVDTTWVPLKIGVYVRHLERWLQYFPLSQFLFVSGERLIADPVMEITRVQDFLGLKRVICEKHLFWMSAMSYKQNLLEKKGAADPEEAQSDAVVIYEKYFSLQATMPSDSATRFAFTWSRTFVARTREARSPIVSINPAKLYIIFSTSKYVSHFFLALSPGVLIVATVLQILIGVNQHDPEQSVSKCTSQDKENRLSIGYIDNLGRFITEIEPDPHRKYESRLTRAVKRLLRKSLAWRIAEMIVREITSLTLGATNLPS